MTDNTPREALGLAIGALADIAFSSDMSLEVACNKAKRIYEEARAALAAPSVADEMMPHVGADEQGNATLEWWCGDRKITMYPMDGMLLKVWGPDCNSDMSEVRLEDADSVRAAFAWLTAAPKQEYHHNVNPVPPLDEPQMVAPQDGMQFWLWKNGDHFLAFTHLYPCFTPGGDPMVLGEPVGRAVFKRSFDRAKQGVCEEGCDADRANERPFPTILHNGQRHELWLVTRDKQGTLKPYGATGPADLPSAWAAEYRAHLCSGARSAM